ALLGERGHRQADDLTVVRRVEAEVRHEDGPLDDGDGRAVERLDHEHPRLRHGDGGHLPQRGRGAVVVGADRVEDVRVRSARADAREVAAEALVGLVDAGLELFEGLLKHVSSRGRARWPDLAPHSPDSVTSVPTSSPRTTRLMFPRVGRANTRIGMRLSRQSVTAVESMTPTRSTRKRS